jgi:hypothetical protein
MDTSPLRAAGFNLGDKTYGGFQEVGACKKEASGKVFRLLEDMETRSQSWPDFESICFNDIGLYHVAEGPVEEGREEQTRSIYIHG